ncbi:MAG: hypothetical protein QHJ73_03640 [Armatimonadota bacterium]|nr:hypothetical protein [Armatimonadota bacterium]
MLPLLVWLLLAPPAGAGALPSGAEVLRRAAQARDGIRDLTVDVEVSVDAPNLQMPNVLLRVRHKPPDKTKLEPLKGFAVIPKGTLLVGDPLAALARHAEVKVVGRGVLEGRPVYHLKLTPTEGRRPGTVEVWIDAERWVPTRVRTPAPGGERVTVDFTYQRVEARYWLPAKSVARLKFPANGGTRPPAGPDAPAAEAPADPVSGTVTVAFRDYKLNTNLPDSLFAEEAKAAPRVPHRRWR